MKILHFSDIHCRDRDIEEIEKCLNFIVKTAKKEQPDIIINAGDTFDSAGIKADSLSAKLIFKVFKRLADIAPVVTIIGTKSHDGQVAETLQYIKARYPVHTSTRPEQIYLCEGDIKTNIEDLEAPSQAPIEAVISMCPAPTKQFFAHRSDIKTSDMEISVEMSKIFMGFATRAEAYGCPHVLVGHWNITGSLISDTQSLVGVDIELSKEQMLLSRADACLMGHIHKAQQLPGSNIFYSGSITSLTWGELDPKGFYIHEFDGRKLIESRFIQTPSHKRIKLSEDITGAGELTSLTGLPLMEALLAGDAPVDVKGATVRVEFKVFQDEAALINIDEIKKSLISSGAKEVEVILVRIPRGNVRSQKILRLTKLRDKLVEMASLSGETVSASTLEKADLLEAEESDKIVQNVWNKN